MRLLSETWCNTRYQKFDNLLLSDSSTYVFMYIYIRQKIVLYLKVKRKGDVSTHSLYMMLLLDASRVSAWDDDADIETSI